MIRLFIAALAASVLVGGVALASRVAPSVEPCSDRPSDPLCLRVGTASPPSLAPSDGVSETDPPPTGAVVSSAPGVAYVFDDEFNGTTLDPEWDRHWTSIGIGTFSRDQTTIRDGVLTIRAQSSGGGWVSDLIDTFGSFQQVYGQYEARIKIPKGAGLWPAFWLARDWAISQGEVDIMEVCANPPGGNDGNDVTILHEIVHAPDGTHVASQRYSTADLSTDWHVYGLDWRADHMSFSFDGAEVFRVTDPTVIPTEHMAVVLDLAVGGWCGLPDSTTPSPSVMQVDWVRVRA
jgi:beta-glucanase (GH16 family)